MRKLFEGRRYGDQTDQEQSGLPGRAEGDRDADDGGTRHPRSERLDVLVRLVEAYENKHYALDLPDPVEAIKFCMEQRGMIPKDMVPFIGRINRVDEVLRRKRPLTLAMIQRLHSDR